MRRRELLRSGLGVAVAGSFLMSKRVRAQEPSGDDSDPAALLAKMGPLLAKIPIVATNLASGLEVVSGPGGNVAVLRGGDGSIVVDCGVPMRAQELLETVKKTGGQPVATLINTHWHFDHAGGNELFARDGAKVIATEATRRRLSTDQYTAAFKMTTHALPPAARPSLTFDEAELHVGDETLHLFSVPPAHTDGDLVVHFTRADVIHTGDLFSNGIYPNIDASSRGWIGGMIAAADRILKIAGPKTRIIPGHGPMATAEELKASRAMLLAVHDRLAPLVDAGKTIEEAIASKPTSDLDAKFGKGLFTGPMFTRIVYEGIKMHRSESGK